ncbi:hypothetical protein, conserved [Eimeria praecox]|uniref:Uncharacterized protein n=1 Tax=Eimeria praecox TaxID=51316 RepID=U6H4B3_9EIME|nr:hypothetical protein, conserved [Eimeria praecox]
MQAISRAFPEDEEPLLPDFKDLNYPEFLPTLVLDFDGVLAKIGHDVADGGLQAAKASVQRGIGESVVSFL